MSTNSFLPYISNHTDTLWFIHHTQPEVGLNPVIGPSSLAATISKKPFQLDKLLRPSECVLYHTDSHTFKFYISFHIFTVVNKDFNPFSRNLFWYSPFHSRCQHFSHPNWAKKHFLYEWHTILHIVYLQTFTNHNYNTNGTPKATAIHCMHNNTDINIAR